MSISGRWISQMGFTYVIKYSHSKRNNLLTCIFMNLRNIMLNKKKAGTEEHIICMIPFIKSLEKNHQDNDYVIPKKIA